LFEPSLVVDWAPAVTVAPEVPTLPLIENVGAVHEALKLTPVTLDAVMVTGLEVGVNVQPLLLGVTV
jgi:hypothetical protein